MAVEVTMPQLSDTMDQGTILTWLVKVGDTVSRGDALAEVSTDKADLEIESFHEGTLLQISAPEGTTVQVGSIIAYIGEAGETVSAAASAPAPETEQQPAPAAAEPIPNPALAPAPAPTPAPPPAAESSDRVKISPLARNMAESSGLDYSQLAGTGEGGRIVKRDIEQALQANGGAPQVAPAAAAPAPQPSPAPTTPPPAAPQPALAPGSTEQLSRMRQTIAARMVEATTTIPHFYVTSKVMVDELAEIKSTLKPLPQYEGLTYNHLLIKAAALALRAVPVINACYKEGTMVQPQQINIGVVTAVPDGLLIPVLKEADVLPLADIVTDARGMVQRARSGRPKAEDLTGSTFAISNMGMFAVESFTAIINPGNGAILAISGIEEEPVVADGEVRVGHVMRATLSVDHRIIDGVMAGEFLTEFKRLVENPVLLLA